MNKRALVIWNDPNHPLEACRSIVGRVFDSGWDVITTPSARELITMENAPDLALSFSVGRAEGDADLDMDEQRKIGDMVKAGMGMIFVHAGLACIQDDTPLFDVALGRFAFHPREHVVVRCAAMPGIEHPVLRGVEPFEAMDEAYMCRVDMQRAQPLMYAVSNAGTEISGWAQELGQGRVCSFTPGHNEEMLNHMCVLLKNAASWCVKETL